MARKKSKNAEGGAQPSGPEEDEEQPDKAALPPHLQVQHDYVVAGEHLNYNTNTVTSALAYLGLGVDNQWSLLNFKDEFRVEVNSITQDQQTTEAEMEFDLKGLDPAVVNAFRRILLAELPTMAIEHVFIIDNSSIIPDEMLAHRLGLVPLQADAALFTEKAASDPGNETNCIVLRLKAACKKRIPSGEVVGSKVLSGQLEWLPSGSQIPEETKCKFSGDQRSVLPQGCKPVHADILLAKLRPGMGFEVECVATKGTGEVHAKWSPVATAWYQLEPEVALLEPIEGEDAEELARLLPGLFSVAQEGGTVVAKAASVRDHPQLQEKVRKLSSEDRWRGRLQFRKRKHHFIFTVQSTGILPPDVLFTRAVDELSAKCARLLDRL